MESIGEVWVFIEVNRGRIAEASLEVLGKGRDLARDLGVPVSGIISGRGSDLLTREVVSYGADKVYLIRSPMLDHYTTVAYARAVSRLVRKEKPEIFLLAATSQGRDLAPRIASCLGTGLTADCTDLKIGSYRHAKTGREYDRILLQIRPAWGGNIIATIVNPETRPQMATIREGMMRLPTPDRSAEGEVIEVLPELVPEDIRTILVREEIREKTVDLKGAGVIVAGGAGVGSREDFELIRKFADMLGGEVAATRAAVDAGFISHDHQVGQTGVTVRPKLYIACGISGAVQHIAGMDESGKILAINTDPDAPIFNIAHYAIVADLREVIPRMMNIYKTLSH